MDVFGSHSMRTIEDMHNICVYKGEKSEFSDLVAHNAIREIAR